MLMNHVQNWKSECRTQLGLILRVTPGRTAPSREARLADSRCFGGAFLPEPLGLNNGRDVLGGHHPQGIAQTAD